MMQCTGFRRVLAFLIACTILLPQLGFLPAVPVNAGSSVIDPVLLEKMTLDPFARLPVIVEMKHAQAPFPSEPKPNVLLAERALDLLRLYGEPVGALPLIDGAAGYSTAAGITAISLDAGVAYIHEDAVVHPRPGKPEPLPVAPPGRLSARYPLEVNADEAWKQGATGRAVGVAVLDSGVMPDIDLTQPTNRLIAAVNFAGDRGPMADAGGHGTHVAGIIAGNGLRSNKEFVGIAPEANVIDVRVLNRHGSGRVSSIVRGIEWVLAHRDQYNIRVVNLSIGAPARHSYRLDPLAAAVEIAWKQGVVVVAAAGNGGQGHVETPGIDPYAITIGALDDLGTLTLADDELAWFSAWGTPSGSTAKPDLVAPGRRIVSIRALGSFLDTLYPERVVSARNGSTYFRLTGTSMSTGVVSGVVALLLERYPELTPDQVKAILTSTTQPYGEETTTALPDPSADGSGLVDAWAAISSTARPVSNGGVQPADTLARSLYPILYGQPLSWEDPDFLGLDWISQVWETVIWNNAAWDNVAWDSFDWTNAAWDNAAWDNAAWDNAAWDNAAWDNAAWDSMTLD